MAGRDSGISPHTYGQLLLDGCPARRLDRRHCPELRKAAPAPGAVGVVTDPVVVVAVDDQVEVGEDWNAELDTDQAHQMVGVGAVDGVNPGWLIAHGQVGHAAVLDPGAEGAAGSGPEVVLAHAGAGARGIDAGEHDGVSHRPGPQPELSAQSHPRAQAELKGLGPELKRPVVQVLEALAELELMAMPLVAADICPRDAPLAHRSEEHTSELQ